MPDTRLEYLQLPKIELHLHLDCSLSYEVVRRLAPEVDEERYRRDFVAPPKCKDLSDFLARTRRSIELMQTRVQLDLITRDLLRQLADENVLYAEIRFAPLLHTEEGLSPGQVVETVHRALEEGMAETGVAAGLILCTLRHFSERQSMETVRLIESFPGSRVVGFDIASDEAHYPVDEHVRAFYFARDRGIPRTAHAGEARGPESVWETLEYFAPSRLGHGVRSIEDPKLIDRLLEDKIHLEICPTSNIQTNVYASMADHPVERLRRAGLSLGINTDGRTIVDVRLTDEYQKLSAHFGWDQARFQEVNLAALQAAFADRKTKKKLREKLIESY